MDLDGPFKFKFKRKINLCTKIWTAGGGFGIFSIVAELSCSQN